MDATERALPGRARRNLVNGSMDVLGMQLEGVGDAHGADPISFAPRTFFDSSCDLRTARAHCQEITSLELVKLFTVPFSLTLAIDRKSTRLNSSHPSISYAVF